MASGWKINGLELPEAPQGEDKGINRTFQQESIYKNYPAIFKPTVTNYSYTLTGYIYGNIINQFEGLAKSADTEVVTVIPPTERLESTKLSTGIYAFSNFTVNRNKYIVTEVNGRVELTYNYTMVLTEFADQGVNGNSLELETLAGEQYLGIIDQLTEDVDETRDLLDLYPNILVDLANLI